MKSAEAIRKVSDALVSIQGVADIGVNGEEGLLEVRFDPGKTSEEEIRSVVVQAGYPPQ